MESFHYQVSFNFFLLQGKSYIDLNNYSFNEKKSFLCETMPFYESLHIPKHVIMYVIRVLH